MKLLWFIIVMMVALFLVYGRVSADFVPSERPTFDVTSGGDTAFQHFMFTGIVPMFSGYAGFHWRTHQ